MTGLYVHIPFCRSRCIYCDFYSTTALNLRQKYVDAVCKEIRLRSEKHEVEGKESQIATIYLGGGTPSQLTVHQLRQIFDHIYIYNKVEKNAEVTIECNPDDITENFANALASMPVNRISMGVQTFNDQRLQFLRRRHTASQVSEAIDRLRSTGIKNLSIDLMYGFPGESLSDWESDIDAALALDVEHISAYCLMIEEGTPLHELRIKNLELRDTFPSEDTEREMYYTLIDRLEAAGYEHYEISNFARPGFRSRHNSNYWNGTPYIGIGAAAHSYDIRSRSWNIVDIRRYTEGMERNERVFDEELIDEDTRYNDTITVGLRTREGIDLDTLSERHRDYCMKNARRYLDDGLLELVTTTNSNQTSYLKLTHRGLFVSDMIMSDLIMV